MMAVGDMVPLWALLALAAAWCVTAIPLIQEKHKADGFALTFWIKVMIACVMAYPVLTQAIDFTPRFYLFVTLSTAIYIISDIIYFKAVPIVGSGIVTRLLPSSVIITFVAWFFVEPARLTDYMGNLIIGCITLGLIGLFIFFAMQLRQCPLSWQGVRVIWPVILAACIGPVFTKIALSEVDGNYGVFAYLWVQSVITVACIGSYALLRRPVPMAVFASRHTIRTAIMIGGVMTMALFLKLKALQLSDNPGYVTMIFFTDALWVLLVYRLIGRKDNSRIWPGLGIVLCAAVLVLIKQYAS